MANPDHVRILKEEGGKAWNAWRESHPSTSPDLKGADLRGANLKGVDPSGMIS